MDLSSEEKKSQNGLSNSLRGAANRDVKAAFAWMTLAVVGGIAIMVSYVSTKVTQYTASSVAVIPVTEPFPDIPAPPPRPEPSDVKYGPNLAATESPNSEPGTSAAAFRQAVSANQKLRSSAIGQRLFQVSGDAQSISDLKVMKATFGKPTKGGYQLITYTPVAGVAKDGLAKTLTAITNGITGSSVLKIMGNAVGNGTFEYMLAPRTANLPPSIRGSSIVKYNDANRLSATYLLTDEGAVPAPDGDKLCWCSAHQSFIFECSSGKYLTFDYNSNGKQQPTTTEKQGEAYVFGVGVPGDSKQVGQDTTQKCPVEATDAACKPDPCVIAIANTGINGTHLCAAALGGVAEKSVSVKIIAQPITAGAACKNDQITEKPVSTK